MCKYHQIDVYIYQCASAGMYSGQYLRNEIHILSLHWIRVCESYPDLTGQPVWWTGKICLTNHDFTRPTPYENKQLKKKIEVFRFECNIMYKDQWPQNIHDSSVNKILIAAKYGFCPFYWLIKTVFFTYIPPKQ